MLEAAARVAQLTVRSAEDWWFDTSRHVRTTGNASIRGTTTIGDTSDSEIYVPARVANARAALRRLPIRDHSEYTFVDLGSGKGRMLFIAAEFPFGRIVGVEFSTALHEAAARNIAQFRSARQRCKQIDSVLEDATQFALPEGKLVLYLFHPFGPETMRRVLENVERSLRKNVRHIVVLLLWPKHSDLVAQMDCMRVVQVHRRYNIYESVTA